MNRNHATARALTNSSCMAFPKERPTAPRQRPLLSIAVDESNLTAVNNIRATSDKHDFESTNNIFKESGNAVDNPGMTSTSTSTSTSTHYREGKSPGKERISTGSNNETNADASQTWSRCKPGVSNFKAGFSSRVSGLGREFWASKHELRGINRGTMTMKKLPRNHAKYKRISKAAYAGENRQTISARGSLHIAGGVKVTQAGIVIHELANSQMQLVASVRQIDAKFELIPLVRLGAGASGTVYSAIHIPSLRLVAVKQVPYHDKKQRKHLVQEIRSLRGNHVSWKEIAFRCSMHPQSLLFVGNATTRSRKAKLQAHTSRRCFLCGQTFCGTCKKFFMTSMGSHRWKCKDTCSGSDAQERFQEIDDPNNVDVASALKMIGAGHLNEMNPEACSHDKNKNINYLSHLDSQQHLREQTALGAWQSKIRKERLRFIQEYFRSHPKPEREIGKSTVAILRRMMKRDACLLRGERCPFIVQMHDAFTDIETGTMSIVMELMGCSLQDMIDDEQPMDATFLSVVACSALQALEFLHSSEQMHRDIKPANILVNGHCQVKIADFGIAFIGDAKRKQRLGKSQPFGSSCKDVGASHAESPLANDFIGTAMYMSPERIDGGRFNCNGKKGYGPPCDVWALGLSIHSCAVGECPIPIDKGFFELASAICDDPAPILPSTRYPSDMKDFLSKCLKKRPGERWTAAQLLKHPFITERATERDLEIIRRGKTDILTSGVQMKDKKNACRTIISTVLQRHIAVALEPLKGGDAGGIGTLAPLPRFHFDQLMGLAEQLDLSVNVVMKIAEHEWQMAMDVLNLRVESLV